jgi:hypothetical protein
MKVLKTELLVVPRLLARPLYQPHPLRRLRPSTFRAAMLEAVQRRRSCASFCSTERQEPKTSLLSPNIHLSPWYTKKSAYSSFTTHMALVCIMETPTKHEQNPNYISLPQQTDMKARTKDMHSFHIWALKNYAHALSVSYYRYIIPTLYSFLPSELHIFIHRHDTARQQCTSLYTYHFLKPSFHSTRIKIAQHIDSFKLAFCDAHKRRRLPRNKQKN